MKTIALRFAENFAPKCGTIAAHQHVIDEHGSVLYGKLGSSVGKHVKDAIMSSEQPRILLIHSGRVERYWAYVSSISKEPSNKELIPSYYRNSNKNVGCWFEVTAFEKAPKDIMSHCIVISSKRPLSSASRHSMSPYFIIEYNEE